jgi:pimeloyl-ACP methyl ester carboxylesterase
MRREEIIRCIFRNSWMASYTRGDSVLNSAHSKPFCRNRPAALGDGLHDQDHGHQQYLGVDLEAVRPSAAVSAVDGEDSLSCRYYLTYAIYAMLPFLYYNRPGLSWPKVRQFIDALRSEDPSIPLGVAGFCWGGKHAILLAHGEASAAGKPLIDAAFAGHPSFLTLPSDIEKVKLPLSIAVGDHDSVLNAAAIKKVEGVLKKLEDVKSEVVVYNDAGHGFCVRADPGREDVLEQSEKAEEQAIRWFAKQFELAGY